MEQLKEKTDAGPALKLAEGFSTIELAVALGIMALVLTAVIMTAFGNQSFLLGSQTNNEALNIAQGLIEQEQALGRKDFNLVNATSEYEADTDDTGYCPLGTDGKPDYIRYKDSDGNYDIYCERVYVENYQTAGKYNYLEKNVIAEVVWKDERGVWKNVQLKTLIANLDNISSSATCNSSPSGDWSNPEANSYSLTDMGAPGGASVSVSDVDAYQDTQGDKLYVTLSYTSVPTYSKFFIFDLTHPDSPSFVNDLDTTGVSIGANALTVVSPSTTKDTPDQKTYAFLANGAGPSPSDWDTCIKNPASETCSQLEVIDVTNPNFLSTPVYFNLGSRIHGGSGQGVGKSIYYRNGYIFLGLTKTSAGPEFNIIDVHDPTAPVWIGGYETGRTVNSIYIDENNYAYLATDDNTGGHQLLVLDISDPTNPVVKWPATGESLISEISSFGVGNAITRVGDNLYFGMTYNSPNPEFFILKNSNPSSVAPSVSDSYDLGQSIGAIIIRDYLENILSSNSNALYIRNAYDSSVKTVNLPHGGDGTAMDCQGNYLYAGDSDGNITVITAN
ncbi:MAG TPA: hypothetical protein VG694_02875 [Candidatus Paceibacterota bacterium]|nr:hypothetical protein [Candidatus Paceibacterota bacterium]